MDRITVRGIRAYGHHGADPGERDHAQPIDVSIELDLDLSAAQRSDRLEDTLDYAAMHRRIVEIVTAQSFALLEALGGCIADALCANAPVARVRVCVSKPAKLDGATPVVCIERVNAAYRNEPAR